VKLTRSLSATLGLLTILPIGYLVFFLTFLIPRLSSLLEADPPQLERYFSLFHTVVRLHLIMIVLSLALIGFYIFYLFKTDRVPTDKKSVWASVLFLGNFLTMPVFWYLYVWREPDAPAIPR
jgi:type II secretory pathway component PulF